METIFTDESRCCGCAACVDVCPVEAVEMTADKCGFTYPRIKQEICIGCGKCKRICPFADEENIKNQSTLAYALRNKSREKVEKSSSGAFFPEIAAQVISEGGVVYASAFDSDFNAVHMRAERMDELDKFRGSRYIQSKTDGIYKAVKKDLSQRKVMFVGTSCQVDALKHFLQKPYDNLITVDVICRGVPSQKLFDDYKKSLEKVYGANLSSYSFRGKRIKGEIQDIYAEFSNGKKYSRAPIDDDFKSLYARTLSLRPSCYQCKYTSTERVGDITLGDFWGIKKVLPDFAGDNGNSLILISSKKGQELFEKVKTQFDFREVPIDKVSQPSLCCPAEETQAVKDFRSDYAEHGYDYIIKKYCQKTGIEKLKAKLKPILKGK